MGIDGINSKNKHEKRRLYIFSDLILTTNQRKTKERNKTGINQKPNKNCPISIFIIVLGDVTSLAKINCNEDNTLQQNRGKISCTLFFRISLKKGISTLLLANKPLIKKRVAYGTYK